MLEPKSLKCWCFLIMQPLHFKKNCRWSIHPLSERECSPNKLALWFEGSEYSTSQHYNPVQNRELTFLLDWMDVQLVPCTKVLVSQKQILPIDHVCSKHRRLGLESNRTTYWYVKSDIVVQLTSNLNLRMNLVVRLMADYDFQLILTKFLINIEQKGINQLQISINIIENWSIDMKIAIVWY